MLIIPAIDIQAGEVVRLTQGAFDKKVYSRDPVKTARHWRKQGASLLHVVDLDGAFSGRPRNVEIARRIAREVDIPVEFGGGVRDIETIKAITGAGIARVVLGTKAIENAFFLKKAFDAFGDRIIVSIDARAGNIVTRGWKQKEARKDIGRFIAQLEELGFASFIYTDVARDGTLKGPNVTEIKRLLKVSRMKIIASGGVAGLEDIRRLSTLKNKGLAGVIVGKALYEGRFTLAEALKLA